MSILIEGMLVTGIMGIIMAMLIFALTDKKKVTCGDDCCCDCE